MKQELDRPEDPEVLAIMKEAEARIAPRQVQASAPSHGGLLVAHRNSDGTIELRPKSESEGPVGKHIKPEVSIKPELAAKSEEPMAEIKAGIKAEIKADVAIKPESPVDEPPEFDDLDPWTKAAITSMETRRVTKAALQGAKKRPSAKTKDDDAEDDGEDDDDEDDHEDDDEEDDTDDDKKCDTKQVRKNTVSKTAVAKRPSMKTKTEIEKKQENRRK